MKRDALLGFVGQRVTVWHGSGKLAGSVTGLLDDVTTGHAWFVGNIGVPIGWITSIQLAAPAGAREDGE